MTPIYTTKGLSLPLCFVLSDRVSEVHRPPVVLDFDSQCPSIADWEGVYRFAPLAASPRYRIDSPQIDSRYRFSPLSGSWSARPAIALQLHRRETPVIEFSGLILYGDQYCAPCECCVCCIDLGASLFEWVVLLLEDRVSPLGVCQWHTLSWWKVRTKIRIGRQSILAKEKKW